MQYNKKAITIFLTVLYSIQPFAQEYEPYRTRHGLPHDNVLSICQDDYGFLWVGTKDGLSFYDGKVFRTYTSVFGERKKKWINSIQTIFEDNEHNIWLGSEDGYVSCFDRKKQLFKQYDIDYTVGKVKCFLEDADNNIWIGFEDGQIGIVNGHNIVRAKICDEEVLALKQLNERELSVLTNRNLYNYNIKSSVVKKTHQYINKLVFDVAVNSIGYNTINDIGLSSINVVDTFSEKTKSIGFVHRSVAYCRIAKSNGDKFYITDGVKIYKYNKDLISIDSFVISDNLLYDDNTVINELFEDNTGILWMGTTSGLYKIDKHKKQFDIYNKNTIEKSLTNNYIRSLYTYKNNDLWVGYRSGKVTKLKYDKLTGKYVYDCAYTLKTSNNILKNTYTVNTFLKNKYGQLMLGGEQGVFTLNKRNEFENLLHTDDAIITQVWTLYEDYRGNIWIGTKDGGLYIYNKQSKKTYNYKHSADDTNTISNNCIWKIFSDTKNRIWIGTDNGLCYVDQEYDISSLSFSRFHLNATQECNVWSIVEDSLNNIWIGTTGAGLYKISDNYSEAVRIAVIQEDVIASIVVDNKNNLWIGTAKGLYSYDDVKKEVVYFDENDGLISEDFNFNAACINQSGKILLGTKLGVISFNPSELTKRKYFEYKVRISNINISGKNFTGALYSESTLHLNRKENDIAIDLSLPKYTDRNILFRYKLVGYDDVWNYLGDNQSRAIYTNIPPGNYTFLAQANDSKGNWTYLTQLKVFIKPALWQIQSVQLFLALLVASVLFYVIRSRFKNIVRKEHEKSIVEKRIALLELDALRAQMNPHFIFNTINSIQGYILEHNEILANEYLTKFARLMRLFLESSKNRFILLCREIELVELYLSLEKMRFEDKLDYQINIADDIDKECLKVPSLLIQPFLENAIKHGLIHRETQGLLILSVYRSCNNTNCIRIIIDDNGIGRQNSKIVNLKARKNHISRGMQMINDRVKTYNFIEEKEITIEIIDKEFPDQGTRVEITIPIDHS